MAVSGGVASDSALSDVSSGYNERSSKRPRLMEPGFYFAVPGSAPGFVGAYIVPPMPFGSKRACMFSPGPYLMSPSIYRPSHASIIQGGESTSGLDKFPAVRIRGPPFNCTELDIYNFFSGLSVVDCLLMNKNGQFTGEAYVVFSSPMLVHLALQRVRQNMGHHYVEVSACKKSDYYNAVAAQVIIFFF
jgi:heterogeneous nuclear ribonucleoprotein F/H